MEGGGTLSVKTGLEEGQSSHSRMEGEEEKVSTRGRRCSAAASFSGQVTEEDGYYAIPDALFGNEPPPPSRGFSFEPRLKPEKNKEKKGGAKRKKKQQPPKKP